MAATLSVLLMPASAGALRRPPPPIISQRFPDGRQPGYRGDSRCGPTSMAMVARGFHRQPQLTDAQLIEMLDRLDDGKVNQATTPTGIVRMSAALELRARVHLGFDGDWLRSTLEHGGLAVALGRPRFLPQTEAHTGGHFISIVGVTPDGKFLVNDPYRRHARGGRRYRVSEAALASFVRHKPNGQLIGIDSPTRSVRSARRRQVARAR